MTARQPWLWLGLVVALAIGVGLSTGWGAGAAGDTIATQQVCDDHLGAGWEPAGVAAHDDWTHYHVKCERDRGLLQTDERWITIEAGEYD